MHFLRKIKPATAVLGAALLLVAGAGTAAYRTHQEQDSEIFVGAYPHLEGTRMDTCDVCHSRISAPPPGAKDAVVLSSCDSCHQVTDYGRRKADTLNSFGKDYLGSGRNAGAFAAIAALDSDRDGFSNAEEIRAATHPGDAASRPGYPEAPHVLLSLDELKRRGLPLFEQALFVNVSKSREGDSYSDIGGFRLIDVLEAAGLRKGATAVDVISLDGYTTTFSIEQLRRKYPQAAPVMGLDEETLGECGWVRYGARGLKEGVPLPDADILLSFSVNGEPYPAASISAEGRLVGSGPLRVVAPQMKNPGIPDISSRATEACVARVPERHRFNRDYEKNSDYCVKAVVALRVHPLPEGTVDLDWTRHAAAAVAGRSVVIFGAVADAAGE
ncbi:MAG: hypothetical protein QM330_12985 [Acidobacteriota bacterium]|jgi:hypothetical protein|nr:hypothetical protein [Acidobacteriota bacterium]NLT31834.1 hypothetical protein [Acidobacteriota bacterium]